MCLAYFIIKFKNNLKSILLTLGIDFGGPPYPACCIPVLCSVDVPFMNTASPLLRSPSSSSSNGQKMLQFCPPVGLVMVAAYMKTGTIRRAEHAHAVRETMRAITEVRNLESKQRKVLKN